jgi:hypothetical protein
MRKAIVIGAAAAVMAVAPIPSVFGSSAVAHAYCTAPRGQTCQDPIVVDDDPYGSKLPPQYKGGAGPDGACPKWKSALLNCIPPCNMVSPIMGQIPNANRPEGAPCSDKGSLNNN